MIFQAGRLTPDRARARGAQRAIFLKSAGLRTKK